MDWEHPEKWPVNGPFLPEKRGGQGDYLLKWNPSLEDLPRNRPEGIRFLPVSGSEEALQLYREGVLHWLPRDFMPFEQLLMLMNRSDFFRPTTLASYFYVINRASPGLDDPGVRKALSLAVGREELIQKVLQGAQQPAWSPVPPMPGFSSRYPSERLLPLRQEEASRLLDKAGYSDRSSFPVLDLLIIETPGHRAVADYLSRLWETGLGVRVSIVAVDALSFYKQRQEGRFDLALGGWASAVCDPSSFLSLFLTGESLMGGIYSSGDFDDFLIESALENNRDRRMALLKKAENLLCSTDSVVIPLYYSTAPQLFRKDLWGGFYTNPLDIHPLRSIKTRK